MDSNSSQQSQEVLFECQRILALFIYLFIWWTASSPGTGSLESGWVREAPDLLATTLPDHRQLTTLEPLFPYLLLAGAKMLVSLMRGFAWHQSKLAFLLLLSKEGTGKIQLCVNFTCSTGSLLPTSWKEKKKKKQHGPTASSLAQLLLARGLRKIPERELSHQGYRTTSIWQTPPHVHFDMPTIIT